MTRSVLTGCTLQTNARPADSVADLPQLRPGHDSLQRETALLHAQAPPWLAPKVPTRTDSPENKPVVVEVRRVCELGGYSATKLLASSALVSNKEMLSVESSGVVLEAKSAVECGGNATRFPADHKSGSSLGHVVRY